MDKWILCETCERFGWCEKCQLKRYKSASGRSLCYVCLDADY